MSAEPAIEAERVIADLRELDRRTGGPEGAQRLCWSEGWREARSFLGELLDEIGLVAELDTAGNLWAELKGGAEPALALGSHLDSVPAGGWLDGALGVMGAVGVLAGEADGVTLNAEGAEHHPERQVHAFEDGALLYVKLQVGCGVL